MPEGSLGSLAVIGGGVIGLSVARQAARAGWEVRVHCTGEPGGSARLDGGEAKLGPPYEPGGSARLDGGEAKLGPPYEPGASWVAGGMLAPHSEGWPGEDAQLRLGLRSLERWHDFLDGLPAEVVTARESLVVAADRADVADLRTVADWLSAQGHPVIWESAARDVEPLLATGIRHGFRAPTELAVDNRAVVTALAAACEDLGVRWAPPVAALDEVAADQVVIANGLGAPTRVIRARVHGRQVYLVPRPDGVVVGATQYEHGRDTAPAVSGVRDLLDDACTLVPALGEYELAECAAGLRPMTPDNLPLVHRLDERTCVAAGHGRNGFLLAPWTAEQVVSELLPIGVQQ